MHIDKDFLTNKINEFCILNSIDLTTEQKDKLITDVSDHYELTKIIDSRDFETILEYSRDFEQYKDIEFEDEIVEIEECGVQDSIDFNVSGNKLFYANNVLTHNSAVNSTDASNDSVSDSIGTVQTADFILFLLQNEKMKEENLITCKCTKNRFTGRTDTWNMNVDYVHMRFIDAVVQDSSGLSEKEVKQIITDQQMQDLEVIKRKDNELKDDFSETQDAISSSTEIKGDFDVESFLGL